MASRQAKRRRTANTSYHHTVETEDDYSTVQSREGRLRRIGNNVRTAPTERFSHPSTSLWNQTIAWSIPDDTEYALETNRNVYDALLEGDVVSEDVESTESSPPQKRRSKVSRRPHVVWKESYRQAYLDEMIRWAGRGDFRTATECPDCVSRKVDPPGQPEYRCHECFVPDLCCLSCSLKRHRAHPFHRIERWVGDRFTKISLKTMGLTVQLNHASLFCVSPIPCHKSMRVLHTNGFHNVAIQYCGCDRAIPHHLQLLRRSLYPASQLSVKTCATFELLDLLHKMALTTKASTYDFYRALEKMTDNTGLSTPISRYRALFRMNTQFRHLKMLKWGGRGHDPAGAEGTGPGELAVLCPSCPRPGINLPDGWESAPKFLYMMFICMDANFRLKNQLVSNYSQDPGLGTGWAYMVPRAPYESYVLSRTNDRDISTCVGLQALAQAHTKYSHGLRYTGVGGAMCGRSEMILPLAIGNLHKGERYSNMDYIFASAIRSFHLLLILISYDIACQWFVNLFQRMHEHWPEELRLPAAATLIPAIPKLHEPMHEVANHQVYSLNYIPGVGQSDLEVPERVWGSHNPLGNATKTQGPGTRHDTLDDHFGFWNWLKYNGQGTTLMKKYKRAIADRNIQSEGHRGLTDSLDSHLVSEWEAICVAWENDAYPKTCRNPYHTEGASLSEFEVRKELAQEEEKRLQRAGQAASNEASASSFVILGLELEELQRRIRRLAKQIKDKSTARQTGGLTEQRNILRNRLRAWESFLPMHMPGLPQYQSKIQSPDIGSTPKVLGPRPNPEDAEIWLPSRIPSTERKKVAGNYVTAIEERLRSAQAADSLDAIRHVLKLKTRMVYYKNKNVRGQRDGTRSRSVIDRVHGKAVANAEKYRAARAALLGLLGPGEWEKTYRVLENKDIRGYQDPDHLRPKHGRKGTLEDHLGDEAVELPILEDATRISLVNEPRTRRDGTGETRRTLSWIWTARPAGADDDDDGDDILRVEWSKSRARSMRAREEVQLVAEEMRRVLVFLEWKAEWWRRRETLKADVGRDFLEGLTAYARTQASLQDDLAISFRTIWKVPLSADSQTQRPRRDDEAAAGELGDEAAAGELGDEAAAGEDDDGSDDDDDDLDADDDSDNSGED